VLDEDRRGIMTGYADNLIGRAAEVVLRSTEDC